MSLDKKEDDRFVMLKFFGLLIVIVVFTTFFFKEVFEVESQRRELERMSDYYLNLSESGVNLSLKENDGVRVFEVKTVSDKKISEEVVPLRIESYKGRVVSGEVEFFSRKEIRHIKSKDLLCRYCEEFSFILSQGFDGEDYVMTYPSSYDEGSFVIPRHISFKEYFYLFLRDENDDIVGFVNLSD